MSDLTDQARESLKQVFDPEAGLNIVDLGLIYDIREPFEKLLDVAMTFTTESCPAGPYLMSAARTALEAMPEVEEVRIELTFEPPWTPERVTADGRSWLMM